MLRIPLVSVIITTRNEEKNIGACLESLKKQTYKRLEIIVVDNASSDNTKAIAREYGAAVYDKGPERSSQRDFGAGAAHGTSFLFLDADMKLTPTVIEESVALIRTKMALVIPEKSVGYGFWAACKSLERAFYEHIDWIEAVRFFRKTAFVKVRGYDEELTGPEDFDIHQRVRDEFGVGGIGRISAYILHNEGNLSLGKIMRKKFYYAKDMKRYAHKLVNKGYYKKQASIFARYRLFFNNPRKLLRNPSIGIGMLFLKTAEFASGFFGYIYYSFPRRHSL